MENGELHEMRIGLKLRLKLRAIMAIVNAESYMVMTDHGTIASVNPMHAEWMVDMYDNNNTNLRHLARSYTMNRGRNEDNQGR